MRSVSWSTQTVIQRVIPTDSLSLQPQPAANPLVVKLLKAANARGGSLSVTQGVMATESSFAEVEAALMQLVKTGYVEITNDPETGVVMYEFREL